MRNVTIVVAVLITSCQVSLKPNSGPLTPQSTMIAIAPANTYGRPQKREACFANLEYQLRECIGRSSLRRCQEVRIAQRPRSRQFPARSSEHRGKALENAPDVALEDLLLLGGRKLLVTVDVALRIVEVVPRLGIDAAHGTDHLRCEQ